MAAFLKPDNLNIVWASGGDRLYPGDTKYASGWGVEIPPRQYFNEIDYKQDQMLAHINQRGIAEWDVDTEYQANKSYTQDTTGTIYRCILTHKGQNPELDVSNTYWEIAFANAGDFYTKTEGDARYAQLSNNGSDYNAITFRTNISLYSKDETYTKTEVDNKTTIASVTQAREQTSNSTLLSPLRLADAFGGANQVHNANGYQKFPGGLILQWGFGITNTTGTTHNFPIPFTTKALQVVVCDSGTDTLETVAISTTLTTTQFTARGSNGTPGFSYIAIGV